MHDSNDGIDKATGGLATGVPLQTTEDHLGRLLGREPAEENDGDEITWRQERDLAMDDDDEALLAEKEVENAEDDVIDADDDDAIRTPVELPDPTGPVDNLSREKEGPPREGHIVSPEDRG